MEEKQKVPETVIHAILERYGLDEDFTDQKEYIHYDGEQGNHRIKVILSVLLKKGKAVVIKILHESEDIRKERSRIENQSAFSESMRRNGIPTPKRYLSQGCYCQEFLYHEIPCNITVEDWCGEEIRELNREIAGKIGELMARMHVLSLENRWEIGCGTLFSAAYWNDVDAFPAFCRIGENRNLNQTLVQEIRKCHDEKLEAIRTLWDRLPKGAVQGDLSINNLVSGRDGLIVFDYNNAGDEVLVSDLVMEGLLTAWEMDIPEGMDKRCREEFFPALLEGYLSVRKLSREEADAAWMIYTLYHGLWFTRIVYHEDSLEKLVERRDYAGANRLLAQMLADMQETDDGRFGKETIQKRDIPATGSAFAPNP